MCCAEYATQTAYTHYYLLFYLDAFNYERTYVEKLSTKIVQIERSFRIELDVRVLAR